MPDISPDPLQELLARLREARDAAAQDPFGDPVLLIALAISRRMDEGSMDLDGIAALVQRLSDVAATDRAGRLAAYVGLRAVRPRSPRLPSAWCVRTPRTARFPSPGTARR